MKRTVNYLTSIIVALATASFGASCSTDELTDVDVEESKTIENNTSKLTVYQGSEPQKLSTKVALEENLITRSQWTENDQGGLDGAWVEGDTLNFFNISRHNNRHDHISSHETLVAQNSGQSAKFEGDIHNASNEDEFSLFFPSLNNNTVIDIDGTNLSKFNIDISQQDGTLEGIAANHDFLYGKSKLQKSGNDFVAYIDELKSLTSITKFTFYDKDNNPINNIKSVDISNVITSSEVDLTQELANVLSYHNIASNIRVNPADNFNKNYIYVAFLPGQIAPHITLQTTDGKVYEKNFSQAGTFKQATFYKGNIKFANAPTTAEGELMITEFYKGDEDENTSPQRAFKHNVIELYNCGNADISSDELKSYSLRVRKSNNTTTNAYTLPDKSNTNPVIYYSVAAGNNDVATWTSGAGSICPGLICYRKELLGNKTNGYIASGIPVLSETIWGSSIRSTCVGNNACNNPNGNGLADIIDEAESGDYVELLKNGEVIDVVLVPGANHSTLRKDSINQPKQEYDENDWIEDRDVSVHTGSTPEEIDATYHTLGQRPTSVRMH